MISNSLLFSLNSVGVISVPRNLEMSPDVMKLLSNDSTTGEA